MGNKYVADRSAILLKAETAPGTFETPTVVLPLEKGNGLWEPNYDKVENNPESAHHGSKETVIITAFADIPVSAKMSLPSDHTLIADAFAACGIAATVETGYVSYEYSSSKKTTASMIQKTERKTTSVYGGRADVSLTCEVGKVAEISFDFKTQLKEIVQLASTADDNTIPSTPTFDKVFMTKDCAAYLVNGNAAHFKKVEFKLGADVGQPKDTCSGACYTKDIKPELQITMSVTEDNEDAFDDLKNGTTFNFVIPLYDAEGVKKWELIAPKCVVIDQKTPEDEGRLNVDRTFECRKTLGDDNFELRAYTA